MFILPQKIAHSSSSISYLIRSGFLLLLTLSLLLPGPLAGQNEKDMPALELGKPIERELAGDAVHSYRIAQEANQFLHVVVEQKGIDVVVTLFAPDDKKVAEVDSPNGTQGPEPLSLVAESTGSYRLEVRSLDAKAEVGSYKVTIAELRPATEPDRIRIAAQQAFVEGELLRTEGSPGSLHKAVEKYQGALPLWRTVNDRAKEAETFHLIGFAYDSMGERKKALDYYSQALPLYRSVGARSGEATTLNNIGNVYDLLGEKGKALDYFKQALPLFHAASDRSGEATVLINMGNVYDLRGEKEEALNYFNRALPLFHSIGARGDEAITLNNIGYVYDSLGETQRGLDYYNQALPLWRAVGDRGGEAATLNNIGVIYDSLGEKQKALDFYNQARPLRHAVGDRSGEAATLNNIGRVYDDLGEKQKALDFFNQALPLRRAVGDRNGEGSTLNNIGLVYRSLGEKQKALDFYNQALLLSRAVRDRNSEATTLNNIGLVYRALREKQKALDFYNQALLLFRAVGNRNGQATTLNNIGRVYGDLGEKQKALDFFDQALPLMRAVGDREGEANTLGNYAHVERDPKNLTEAHAHIEAAFAIIESLRTKIASQELRSSYFATVQSYYELYINILMRLHKSRPSEGYDVMALQASERARARSLLETLAEANADIRQGVDPKLVERERSLQQQLSSRAQRQFQLKSGPHSDEQAQALAKEIESLTTELQQIEAQIRQTSPRYAALTQPQPLTLKEIQTQVLDEDTLLLEYSLGEDQSFLWAVTTTSIASFELPKRDEIEALAREVYALLTDTKQWDAKTAGGRRELTREKGRRPYAPDAAARLSQMLLGPVAAQLGNKRLLIVADGALQYIPFGALPTPDPGRRVARGRTGTTITGKPSSQEYQPLVVEHEIISLPSASTLAVLRKEVKDRKPAEKTVAILADPVFENEDERVRRATNETAGVLTDNPPRAKTRELPLGMERAATESGLTGAGLKIPRLPATRDEAKQILSLFPPAQSKGSFDFEASRQTATSGDLSQYRYVHFATHGFLNSVHPELSGIVLSMVNEKGNPQDGFLRAHEVFNLKLPAELVVLSACQTGLGKEVRGEGLVSLTRGFMYAGAPRVVVSLWSVNDEATAELMGRFYRGMLTDKLRPAAALRAAQVSLMKERAWKSPYYWAAFTIQGEWR